MILALLHCFLAPPLPCAPTSETYRAVKQTNPLCLN